MGVFGGFVKLISPVWKFLRSKWKVIVLALVSIAVALVLRNLVVAAVGIVGALLGATGKPTDSPRRTASGNLPNNPKPGTDGANPNPNPTDTPGTPSGGPRRRRR